MEHGDNFCKCSIVGYPCGSAVQCSQAGADEDRHDPSDEKFTNFLMIFISFNGIINGVLQQV